MVSNPRPFAFTLVHGTWARESTWTKDESAFRKNLSRECATSINFARVEWLGRNRAGDRRGGADLLRNALRERFQTSGDAAHFVIAHSHGGNVAVEAAADAETGKQLAGIVCLNTPFIGSINRNLMSFFLLFLFPVLFFFPIWLMDGIAVIGFRIPPDIGLATEWTYLSTLLHATWLPCVIVAAMFLVLMARLLSEPTRVGKSRVIESSRVACPVLCIRTAGDEAFGGLSLLEALAELPNLLLHPATGLLALVVFTALALAGVLPPMVDDGPLVELLSTIAFPTAHRMVVTLETALSYFCAFLLGMLALSIVTGFIFRGMSLGLGFNYVAGGSDLRTRTLVSLVPLNASQVEFVDVIGTDIGGILSHSSAYNDEEVVGFIAQWCAKRQQEMNMPGSA